MSQQLDLASGEFEDILARMSQTIDVRLRQGFQITTVQEGIRFRGAMPYFAPGSFPNQTGPSAATAGMEPFMLGMGDSAPMTFNLMEMMGAAPPSSPTANPGSVPPTGPEETLRYSCTDGKCLQDPNGQYYGIEECQESGCSIGPGTDPDGDGGTIIIPSGQAYVTFKAQITGAAGPYTAGSKTYWSYSWLEVVSVGIARNSTDNGAALNEFELSVENSGGNVVPASATLTRKKIPTDTVLPMHLDETGEAWFCLPNPLEVTCT